MRLTKALKQFRVAVLVGGAAAFVILGAATIPGAYGAASKEVVVGQGSIGASKWIAWLHPNARRPSKEHVCTGIVLKRPEASAISESDECATVGDHDAILTLISGGSGKKKRTVIAVVFGPEIASFHAYLRFGGVVKKPVNRIGAGAAHRLGIEDVGVWTRGFAGGLCLRRLVAYNARGAIVNDSGRLSCG